MTDLFLLLLGVAEIPIQDDNFSENSQIMNIINEIEPVQINVPPQLKATGFIYGPMAEALVQESVNGGMGNPLEKKVNQIKLKDQNISIIGKVQWRGQTGFNTFNTGKHFSFTICSVDEHNASLNDTTSIIRCCVFCKSRYNKKLVGAHNALWKLVAVGKLVSVLNFRVSKKYNIPPGCRQNHKCQLSMDVVRMPHQNVETLLIEDVSDTDSIPALNNNNVSPPPDNILFNDFDLLKEIVVNRDLQNRSVYGSEIRGKLQSNGVLTHAELHGHTVGNTVFFFTRLLEDVEEVILQTCPICNKTQKKSMSNQIIAKIVSEGNIAKVSYIFARVHNFHMCNNIT